MRRISDNLELRIFSQDEKANGETDFKGETSTLSTKQRVEFLEKYARALDDFYPELSLYREVASLKEAKEILDRVKPQPNPTVRKRICLDEWKWTGYSAYKKKSVPPTGRIPIPEQDFRCLLEYVPKDNIFSVFMGEAAKAGINEAGVFYYISDGDCFFIENTEPIQKITYELDFVYRKWNLYLNDRLKADFVPFSESFAQKADWLEIQGGLADIWGVEYHKLTENLFEPFSIHTFIDANERQRPDMNGWMQREYDDTLWEKAILPISHGGERFAGEDLYLRRRVILKELTPHAELYMESITPGGEVYINGRLAAFVKDGTFRKTDITEYLVKGENLIAVKVYADKVKHKMTHTNTDHYTGWFAGRMHLDLLPEIYIDDVFTYTDHITEKEAVQKIKVGIRTKLGTASAKATKHTLEARMCKWFPEEDGTEELISWETKTYPNITEETEAELHIPHPDLWTAKSPVLYKLAVTLKDEAGKICDDYVITAGIRTVSQEKGIFRINGKPELLRAPLLFGSRPPLDKIAAWEKCPPAEYYVQEMLMVKRMNGNGFRMSVHDETIGGINDPRICELADQLGIMLIWQTSAWIRLTAATNINTELLKKDIGQVRNHPSIVIWQPTNHPSWKDWDMIMKVYHILYDAIVPMDPSRLISPAADSRRARPRWDDGLTDFDGNKYDSCDPIWNDPVFCRGNMDYILGYGNEWSALREWPNVKKEHLPNWMESTAYIPSYINSPVMSYFNFEQDEIAGQPCWELHKGKPQYHVYSYEKDYDEGSIGRSLTFAEWYASQGWQALGAYETAKKNRWLDYDGICWCNLRGGQNTVTYQKCLVDYYGQPKLSFLAHRMVFQDVLACSGNVDMVYGPEDTIPVIVMNLGRQKEVKVTLCILAEEGKCLYQKEYEHIILPEGRTVTRIENMRLPMLKEDTYMIRYTVDEI